MRTAFVRAAVDLLDEVPQTAIVLADISADRFADASERHPGRVVNVGIREQLMVSVSAGMALEGLRPFVHSYAPFLVERPYEQLKLDVGHQEAGVVLVSIGASYDGSREGRTHQAPGDVAALDALTGWRVHVPGHPAEIEPLMRAAAQHRDPEYIRLSSQQNTAAMGDGSGKMTQVRSGRKATVIAVGPTLDATLDAVQNLDVTVLYATSIRPFDGATLRDHMAQPNVVLVEPYLEGTSAHAVSSALQALPHRLLSVGVQPGEVRRYGDPADHVRAHGLDPQGIASRVRAFLDT